jgi:uncharacterized protein (UPF0218 family)
MVRISERAKEQMKKPLGTLEDISRLRCAGRLITIGDVCTVAILRTGAVPHLAVFDHHTMRSEVDRSMVEELGARFPNPRRYSNPAGTVSDELLRDAGKLIDEGGAILIDGEEDLTALAFIMVAKKDDIILYGQPGEGVVVVRPGKRLKKKIEGWLSG